MDIASSPQQQHPQQQHHGYEEDSGDGGGGGGGAAVAAAAAAAAAVSLLQENCSLNNPFDPAASTATTTTSAATTTTSYNHGSCNPHGIDNILNRGSSIPGASSNLPSSYGLSDPPTGATPPGSTTTATTAGTQLGRPPSAYWPGIQGLISNPSLWRERVYLHGKTATEAIRFEARI